MRKSILITGAGGRLGQAAVRAFANRGWQVCTLVRTSTANAKGTGMEVDTTEYIGDVRDFESFHRAASGCDVILHAANPSYEHWAEVLPESTRTLIEVAKSVDATIIMPGNVYPFGETMPSLLTAQTPYNPSCEHGRLRAEMEQSLKLAADQRGVQILLLRAGGYIDGRDTGNWFESYMCKDLERGKFMYPGAMDSLCEWIYLPDVANAMVHLAELRDDLGHYEDIGIPGFSVSGDVLHNALEDSVGNPLKLTSLPWWIVRAMSWFVPKMKGVYDLRYLFFVPHAIDGTRLQQLLPNWRPTTLRETLRLISGSQTNGVLSEVMNIKS